MTASSRLSELLGAVPSGEFYDAAGQILPHHDKPHSLSVAVPLASSIYLVKLDGNVVGEKMSDSDKNISLSMTLPKGTHTIECVSRATGASTKAIYTVRSIATVLGGVADVINEIDDTFTSVRNARSIDTADLNGIDAVWGRRLNYSNVGQYGLETYRDTLVQLHQAYRFYGGKTKGLNSAVAAITNVNPYTRPASLSNQWVLGDDFVHNRQMREYTRPYNADLTTINANGAGASIVAKYYRPTASNIAVDWNGVTRTFTLTESGGQSGVSSYVPLTGTYSGMVELSTTVSHVFTHPAAYNTSTRTNLTIGLNDKLLTVSVPASGALSAASLATAINSAITADPRFTGSSFTATALAQRVRLSTGYGSDVITIHPSSTADAAPILFGIDYIQTSGTTTIAVGDTEADITVPSGSLPLTSEVGNYDILVESDRGLRQLTVLYYTGTGAVKVSAVGAATAAGGTITIAAGSFMYRHGTFPLRVQQGPRTGRFTINVADCSKLPTIASTTGLITNTVVHDPAAPDEWWWYVSAGSTADVRAGLTHSEALIRTISGTASLASRLDKSISQYAGYPYLAKAVVSRYYDTEAVINAATVNVRVSWNNGSTWQDGTPVSITSSPVTTVVSLEGVIPATVTTPIIRIEITSASGCTVVFEQASLKVKCAGGLYLGSGTIARGLHRSKRGYNCFVWAPTELTTAENKTIGIGGSGQIDYITPAHTVFSKYNVTSYSAGLATNVKGAITYAELTAGTLTNLTAKLADPTRLSYLYPTNVSRIRGERVYPGVSSPYHVTLAATWDRILNTVVLYEDGVPVPHTGWTLDVGTNSFSLNSTPNNTAVYTVDYDRLTQFESAVIDLSSYNTAYTWLADFHAWQRLWMNINDYPVTYGIVFNNNVAPLPERCNLDKAGASLMMNDGKIDVQISSDQWYFADTTTVAIDPAAFVDGNIYTITYTARSPTPTPTTNVVVEMRQAATALSIPSATYFVVDINQVVNPAIFAPFRVTISSIEDTSDVKIYSTCVKTADPVTLLDPGWTPPNAYTPPGGGGGGPTPPVYSITIVDGLYNPMDGTSVNYGVIGFNAYVVADYGTFTTQAFEMPVTWSVVSASPGSPATVSSTSTTDFNDPGDNGVFLVTTPSDPAVVGRTITVRATLDADPLVLADCTITLQAF